MSKKAPTIARVTPAKGEKVFDMLLLQSLLCKATCHKLPLIQVHFCKPWTYKTVHLSKGFFGLMGGCMSYKGGPSRCMPPGKLLKYGPLRVHFQHSGAKIRVLNRTQTSLNFGFFGG